MNAATDFDTAQQNATSAALERSSKFDKRAREAMDAGEVERCWYFRGCADAAIGYIDIDSSGIGHNLYAADYNEGHTDECAR